MSDPKEERGFTLEGEPKGGQEELPSIDFSTFVLSLGASALLHLGRTPDPVAGEPPPPEKNLPLARQTIDTLEMLALKTHWQQLGIDQHVDPIGGTDRLGIRGRNCRHKGHA